MAAILDRVNSAAESVVSDFEVGESVKVVDGTFKDSTGEIVSINNEASEVRVKLEFFGRDTEVDLPIAQIKKL
jgi:transcriptional antiterminator NusG